MMKNLINWFRENVYPRESEPAVPVRRPPVRVRPPADRGAPKPDRRAADSGQKESGQEKEIVPDGVSALTGRVEEVGPGKNVFVPSKYSNPNSDTQDSLKIVGEEELEIEEEEEGIDPYNTGHFKLKDNWKKSFNK